VSRNGDVRELLASLVGADLVDGVQDEDLIFEQGLIDSLYLVQLIDLVETRFGIRVAGEELAPENFESIAAMTRYVAAKTA